MMRARLILATLLVLGIVHAPPAAADVHICDGETATIVGTEGSDRDSSALVGTAGDDVIVGLGGHDEIRGLAGNDRICGGEGDDDLFGDDGDDHIEGGAGRDEVSGLAGNDDLNGGENADWFISGGLGDDVVDGGPGGSFEFAAYVLAPAGVTVDLSDQGTPQNTVSAGVDTLLNVEGLMGSRHDDTLIGTSGNDYFIGNRGDDTIDAGGGDDYIDYTYVTLSEGGVSVDLSGSDPHASGGDGSDTLDGIENVVGSCQADTLIGNSSANTLFGRGSDDVLRGGAGNDALHGDDVVGEFACSEYGDDDLDGGKGIDALAGGRGDDTVDGGPGEEDAVTYGRSVDGGVSVYLEGGTAVGEGSDVLSGLEVVYGSPSADVIHGSEGDDLLLGDDGDDQLWGREGNDRAAGGNGDDRIAGGAGFDVATYFDVCLGAVEADLYSGSAAAIGSDNECDGAVVSAGEDELRTLEGLAGSPVGGDLLRGDSAHNTLYGGGGLGNVLVGRGGFDIGDYSAADSVGSADLAGGTASYTAGGYGSSDQLSELDVEGLWGSDGIDLLAGDERDNLLVGGDGGDTLLGAAGDDYLEGQGGTNEVDGGAGIDTLDHVSAATKVTVRLTAGWSKRGEVKDPVSQDVNIVSIENVAGGRSGDRLSGDGGRNFIFGDKGKDRVAGAAGNDALAGGAGKDSVSGGKGRDRCGDRNDALTGCEKLRPLRGYILNLETARSRRISENSVSIGTLLNNLERLKHKRLKHKRT